MNFSLLEEAAEFARGRWPGAEPRVGFVLGSGWGAAAHAFVIADEPTPSGPLILATI